MNISIEHLHITVNITQTEPAETPVQETPVRRCHRDGPKIDEHKQDMLELKQQQLQLQAQRLQRKLMITQRLRNVFGDEVANSVLGGII